MLTYNYEILSFLLDDFPLKLSFLRFIEKASQSKSIISNFYRFLIDMVFEKEKRIF
jgi:hypothetical protein